MPGFWTESPEQAHAALADNAALVEAIGRLAKRIMVWSYCTGVCLVAAARRLSRTPITAGEMPRCSPTTGR